MPLPWLAVALALAVPAIPACGQKGPLYLPGESPRPVLPGGAASGDDAAATPGAAEEEEDEKKDGDDGS